MWILPAGNFAMKVDNWPIAKAEIAQLRIEKKRHEILMQENPSTVDTADL